MKYLKNVSSCKRELLILFFALTPTFGHGDEGSYAELSDRRFMHRNTIRLTDALGPNQDCSNAVPPKNNFTENHSVTDVKGWNMDWSEEDFKLLIYKSLPEESRVSDAQTSLDFATLQFPQLRELKPIFFDLEGSGSFGVPADTSIASLYFVTKHERVNLDWGSRGSAYSVEHTISSSVRTYDNQGFHFYERVAATVPPAMYRDNQNNRFAVPAPGFLFHAQRPIGWNRDAQLNRELLLKFFFIDETGIYEKMLKYSFVLPDGVNGPILQFRFHPVPISEDQGLFQVFVYTETHLYELQIQADQNKAQFSRTPEGQPIFDYGIKVEPVSQRPLSESEIRDLHVD